LLYRLPAWIRQAVLRGLFSADGHTARHSTGYATPTVHATSPTFHQDVLRCLWSVGVASNLVGDGWNRHGTISVQAVSAFVERIGYLQSYKNDGIERSDRSKDRWDRLHPGFQRALAEHMKASPCWMSLPDSVRREIGETARGNRHMSRPRAMRWLAMLGEPTPDTLYYCQTPIDVMDIEPIDDVQMFDVEVLDDEHMFLANFVGVHNTQGSVAKGMLNLPKVPDQKLRIFSRQWHMVISGVMNAWRTPITNFEDAKWIDLQKSNRDMEWAEFINFLIKLFCGICQIDPQELNFQYGNVGQTQALSSGAPAEEKVKASKDRGLRPLLRSIAYWINRWLIWRINPKYKLVFMGLDPREGETVVNIEQKQVSYLKTVNELRAENDLKPLPPDEGDLILNPSWIQVYQAKKAMEQQAQMGGPPGQDQGGDGQDGPPGQDQQGGDQQGGDQQDQGGEDQDWPNMMQDHLGKAHVSERKAGDTIEYEIDL